MLYAATFPGYKIDSFLQKFYRFFEWCRLGGLNPFLCKGSKCELFPNTSPRKGMETQNIPPWERNNKSFQILRPAREWKLDGGR
jgi:hypothetical protein